MQSHPEIMRDVASKATETGLPRLLETHYAIMCT